MIEGGNWWRANEIVMRHLTRRLETRYRCRDKALAIILLLFVAAASFLSGRDAPKRFGLQVNMIHMAVIGLAVGLVVVLNNPFRGQTSIDPVIIRNAPFPEAHSPEASDAH